MGNSHSIKIRYIPSDVTWSNGRSAICDLSQACKNNLGYLHYVSSINKNKVKDNWVEFFCPSANWCSSGSIIVADNKHKANFLDHLEFLPSGVQLIVRDYILIGVYDEKTEQYLPIEAYYVSSNLIR